MKQSNSCCENKMDNDKSIKVIEDISLTGKEINSILSNMETSIKKISNIISESSELMETRKHNKLKKETNYLFITIFICLFVLFNGLIINSLYVNKRLVQLESKIIIK